VSKIEALHDKARRAIESGEKAFGERAREAAQYLAEARKLGAKQQESASAIGKSVGWVNALLKWHDGGYKTDCPFPRAVRRERIQPAERAKRSSHGPPTSAEEARARTARATAEQAKAEAQKAKAEASKARAEAKKARSENSKAQAEARAKLKEAFAKMYFSWGEPEKKKIHSGARELLIKALGMLGSDHAGERANAALIVEKQRARLGMTWEELIVSADDDEHQEQKQPFSSNGAAAHA
jgi:hypothetical protein